jgi:hypothetical protein
MKAIPLACLWTAAILALTGGGGCSGNRTTSSDAVVEIEEIERLPAETPATAPPPAKPTAEQPTTAATPAPATNPATNPAPVTSQAASAPAARVAE